MNCCTERLLIPRVGHICTHMQPKTQLNRLTRFCCRREKLKVCEIAVRFAPIDAMT